MRRRHGARRRTGDGGALPAGRRLTAGRGGRRRDGRQRTGRGGLAAGGRLIAGRGGRRRDGRRRERPHRHGQRHVDAPRRRLTDIRVLQRLLRRLADVGRRVRPRSGLLGPCVWPRRRAAAVASRGAAGRARADVGRTDDDAAAVPLTVVLEQVENLLAVGLDEVGPRLPQRLHDVVDEPDLTTTPQSIDRSIHHSINQSIK